MRIAELERDLGLVRTYLSNTASVLNATKAENATLSARVKALEEDVRTRNLIVQDIIDAIADDLDGEDKLHRVITRAQAANKARENNAAIDALELALTSPNPSAEKGAD